MKLTRAEKIKLLNAKSKPQNPDAKWMQIAKWNEEHADALEDYVIIALRISATLKERKMTQKELAEKLNVSPQALTRIMKGRQNLTLNKVRQIEKVLGVSMMKVNKVENCQLQVKTKLIPVEVHYNLSKSAFEGDVKKLDSTINQDQRKSTVNLRVAS